MRKISRGRKFAIKYGNCIGTCTRVWTYRCRTTALNTSVCMKPISMYKHLSCAAFKIKLTTGSGNAGTRDKLHDRSRIRLRQKAGVFASALTLLQVLNCGTILNHSPIGLKPFLTFSQCNRGTSPRTSLRLSQCLSLIFFHYLYFLIS